MSTAGPRPADRSRPASTGATGVMVTNGTPCVTCGDPLWLHRVQPDVDLDVPIRAIPGAWCGCIRHGGPCVCTKFEAVRVAEAPAGFEGWFATADLPLGLVPVDGWPGSA